MDLTANTIDANSRFIAVRDEVSHQALTMGIKTIMQAYQILMVVSGVDQADIVKQTFCRKTVLQVPTTSILQTYPNVILVGERAALSKLQVATYF